MKRIIRNVAVLGSGVMGSQIACHFANAGCNVLLLDIVPKELNENEKAENRTLDDPKVRNRIVNENLDKAVGAKIAPLYKKSYLGRIRTGNFEDDLSSLKEADWIVEAIVENLDIKNKLFEKVEDQREKGTLITSNTSGIPINLIARERSEDFKKHFAGTHFFNPPRYLPLLEIIPNKNTSRETLDFLSDFGDRYLGKTAIQCKDTPAFIANRIGIYAIMLTFELMDQLGLKVEEVDTLTGPVIGRPKSATFRTCDLVGLDVLADVAHGLHQNLTGDEEKDLFQVPGFLQKMIEKGWLGEKKGQGFYKKIRENGKSKILALDLNSLEYQPREKVKFSSLEQAKAQGSPDDRIKTLLKGKDKAGEFYRKFVYRFLSYVSHRIPEIADYPYQVDQALKAGFGWEAGPFENWDQLDVGNAVETMKKQDFKPAPWVEEMLKNNVSSFYKREKGIRKCYDPQRKEYREIPASRELIFLDDHKEKIVWKNEGATLYDIGDEVLNLAFHTQGNSVGSEVLEGIDRALDITEKDYRGLVIANEGKNFSVGANLGLIFMLALEQEYDELTMAVNRFQQAMLKVKYSPVPVVVAPHQRALGGGTELCMHADAVQAAAETYMGLVEVGVGLIPAGGGTTGMTRRASRQYYPGDPEIPHLQNFLLTIAQAKVSYSAPQAFDLGYLESGKDRFTMNRSRLIHEAKQRVLYLSGAGYSPPFPEKIKVLGRQALSSFYVGANAFYRANYITGHDKKISSKLAYVMCGGDLTSPQEVPEQYLLDLEKEAFLSLLGEKKTVERIESVLNTGKPLRN